MSRNCPESCPIIAECRTNLANAEFFVALNEAAISRTEDREMNARFSYAELEEKLLAEDDLLGWGPKLLESSGWLLDRAEHASSEASEEAPRRAEYWRTRVQEWQGTEASVLANCGFWAHLRADFKRKRGVEPFACGSENAYARVVASGLKDGSHKPTPNFSEQHVERGQSGY